MNFEDLQNSWKAQPVNAATDIAMHNNDIKSRWAKHQRKTVRNNWFVTIAFAFTLVGIGWVYLTYRNQFGSMFGISIASIYVLLIVYLFVLWKAAALRAEHSESSSHDFITYQIGKLKWQRQIITRYSWVYAILLWGTLVPYILEVAHRGSTLFIGTALAITTIWIFGATAWGRFYKNKQQLKDIDRMIDDLNRARQSLTL